MKTPEGVQVKRDQPLNSTSKLLTALNKAASELYK